MEYFLSNEMVLEELYSLVFGTGAVQQQTYTPADGDRNGHAGHANTFSTTKSEGKLKYTFNYGKFFLLWSLLIFSKRIWKCK